MLLLALLAATALFRFTELGIVYRRPGHEYSLPLYTVLAHSLMWSVWCQSRLYMAIVVEAVSLDNYVGWIPNNLVDVTGL